MCLVLVGALRWRVSSRPAGQAGHGGVMNGTGASSGEEGFFALAKALGAFKAVQLEGQPSDRALAKTAGVSATTVGMARGERFPQQIDVFLQAAGNGAGRGRGAGCHRAG